MLKKLDTGFRFGILVIGILITMPGILIMMLSDYDGIRKEIFDKIKGVFKD